MQMRAHRYVGMTIVSAFVLAGLWPGSLLAQSTSADQSIGFAQRQVTRKPCDATAYHRLGDAYIQKARESGDVTYFDLAERALRKALELAPRYGDAARHLAFVLYSRHDFDGAAREAPRGGGAVPGGARDVPELLPGAGRAGPGPRRPAPVRAGDRALQARARRHPAARLRRRARRRVRADRALRRGAETVRPCRVHRPPERDQQGHLQPRARLLLRRPRYEARAGARPGQEGARGPEGRVRLRRPGLGPAEERFPPGGPRRHHGGPEARNAGRAAVLPRRDDPSRARRRRADPALPRARAGHESALPPLPL